jgi:tetratricopeptide (TPR) repeat protein
MFCTLCGTKNAADSNFCRQCGGKLEKLPASKISPDDFERALPEDEQTMALLERAYSLRKSGDLDGAMALCEQSLRLRSDSTSTHSLLGQLYEEKGNRAAAIGEYERVLALNPGSIADRVKLDELRAHENGSGGESAGRPHARVLMSDSHRSPVFDTSRFTSVGVTVGLLVLGGLVAMQFRPHTTSTPPLSASTPGNASTAAAVPNAQTPGTGVATGDSAKTFGDIPGKPQIGATSVAGPVASNAIPIQNQVNPPIIYQYQTPPQKIYIPGPAPNSLRNANGASASGKRARAAGNNGGGNDDSNKRFILPGDPDVDDGSGKITVKVGENDVPGKQTDKNASDKGDDANLPGKFGSVEVDKSHSTGTRAVPSAPTGDARSLMVVGEDRKRGKDYRGAIDAFTRALANAGDQAGYVYQRLALCYQNLNDVSSAKTNYERAIDAYRKLESHDPETARNGIRVCQAGIKTCGN